MSVNILEVYIVYGQFGIEEFEISSNPVECKYTY